MGAHISLPFQVGSTKPFRPQTFGFDDFCSLAAALPKIGVSRFGHQLRVRASDSNLQGDVGTLLGCFLDAAAPILRRSKAFTFLHPAAISWRLRLHKIFAQPETLHSFCAFRVWQCWLVVQQAVEFCDPGRALDPRDLFANRYGNLGL